MARRYEVMICCLCPYWKREKGQAYWNAVCAVTNKYVSNKSRCELGFRRIVGEKDKPSENKVN